MLAAQVSTGFSSHMSFAQRVENVITYAVVGLIDWVAFHRYGPPAKRPVRSCCLSQVLALLTPAQKPTDAGLLRQAVPCWYGTPRLQRCVVCRSVYLPLSVKHGIDLGSRDALRRGVMHLFNIDFALEWPRALPPNVKLVGPLMPEPPKALPADLQVHTPGHA